jgi:pyruvate formate lyase activating enzyme
MDSPFIREARLQEPANGQLRCLTCERHCLLDDGQVGWCRTRENRAGMLYTLTSGAISPHPANPIEKKPLYHFFPGSVALTSGAWSCNFGCSWCQNHSLSKAAPRPGRYMSPLDFVTEALNRGCQGTSISLNEPTLSLEWSLDVFRLARTRGLYNTYVTNGYMTPQALDLLVEAGLDAMNVDLKGDADAVYHYCQGIDVEKVWRNCRLTREMGVHLELTTLVIPGVNDSDGVLNRIAERIVAELGADVPWHLSAYHPAYRFDAPPTPVSTLEQACEIGEAAGLRYVYLGNVLGHPLENTYCPGCDAPLIQRRGLGIISYHLKSAEISEDQRPKSKNRNSPMSIRKEVREMEQRIGRVTHFYNRICVAVLDLSDRLEVGDVIRIRGRSTDFTQEVRSLEIEHEKVQSVGPGAEVALEVLKRVRRNDTVYKVIEE